MIRKDGSHFIVYSLRSGAGNGAIGFVNHYGDCMEGRPNYGSFVGRVILATQKRDHNFDSLPCRTPVEIHS